MNDLSVIISAFSFICIYLFFFYIIIYIKNKQDFILWFAVLCLFNAVYDLVSAGLYNAESFTEGIFWQRLQLADLNFATISFLWFFWTFLKLKNKFIPYILTIYFLIFFVLGIIFPSIAILEISAPKSIDLGSLFNLKIFEGDLGIFYSIQIISIFFGIIFLFLYVFFSKSVKITKSLYKNFFLICFFIFTLSCTNDILVGLNIYTFIYTLEFGYLIIIFFMSYIFLDHYFQMFKDISKMNIALEKKVIKGDIELEEKKKEVKQLHGFLPICASCKKIRDDKGYWNQIETYISKHSEVKFSHGICQDCSDKLYGDLDLYKKKKL